MQRCALAVSSFLIASVQFSGAALGSVIASGAIIDTHTTYTPFSNWLAIYSSTAGNTLQDGVTFNDFNPGLPGYPSRHAEADSGGGPGFVNGHSYSEYIQNVSAGGGGSYFMGAESDADATWGDIVVTGPAGPAMVPFSVNMLIHGSKQFSGSSVVDPDGVGWSQISAASFGLWINGSKSAEGNWGVRSNSGAPDVTYNDTGVFAGFNGAFAGASFPIMVPVNTPFSIRMFLLTQAEITVPVGGSLDLAAATDFANTASFATTGQAFNVPDGYTVNSVEAGVTDNVFTLVPAPGTAALLGLSGVVGVRRRR